MHHPGKRYWELAEKWLNGTITDPERNEFLQWYDEEQEDSLFIPEAFASSEEALRQRIFKKIQNEKRARLAALPIRRYWIAAASILLVLGIPGILFFTHPKREGAFVSKPLAQQVTPVVKPGSDKAVLILSDGSSIVLDSSDHGLIAKEKNTKIIKLANGQVAYEGAHNYSSEITYNTLSTPVGGQYAIMLSDGTKVWLNSSSSLHFPTLFAGSERVVELSGEAYFEVAHNAHMPFKVKVGDADVKVLGTHFNIMAYSDEGNMATTLLEGAVQFNEKGSQMLLAPGQQVSSDHSGKLALHKSVNMEQVMAWKNGYFQFDKTELSAIMRQVARWYDVQVDNSQHISGHFSGTISKNVPIEKVLHMIELTGAVRFTLNGKKILIHY